MVQIGRAPLMVLILFVLAASAGTVVYRGMNQRASKVPLEDLGPAPAFALTDQDDRVVRSQDLVGKVWIANVIYTHCTDYCPALTAKMRRVQRLVHEDPVLAGRVMLLSFSTDPDRDTPEVLREYGAGYAADFSDWAFLTDGPDPVRRVIIDGFHLGVSTEHQHDSGGDSHGEMQGYTVFHSNRFIVVDRSGRIRAYPDGNETDAEEIVAAARSLL